MFKRLKQKLIQKVKLSRPNYIIENKINVLIQINEYFTKHNWLRKINGILKESNNINFIFAKNKFQILRTINFCDAGFFDLSGSYLNSTTKLKMIYLGLSGYEFDQTVFPKIKVYSSKGISSSAIADYVLSTTILIINNYNKSIENKVLHRWNQKQIFERIYMHR